MKNVSGSYSNYIKERPGNSEIGIGQPNLLDQVRDRIRTKHKTLNGGQDVDFAFLILGDNACPGYGGDVNSLH